MLKDNNKMTEGLSRITSNTNFSSSDDINEIFNVDSDKKGGINPSEYYKKDPLFTRNILPKNITDRIQRDQLVGG